MVLKTIFVFLFLSKFATISCLVCYESHGGEHRDTILYTDTTQRSENMTPSKVLLANAGCNEYSDDAQVLRKWGYQRFH